MKINLRINLQKHFEYFHLLDYFLPELTVQAQEQVDTVREVERAERQKKIELVEASRIWRNIGACPGDVLLLTKPLGAGLLVTGARKGLISEAERSACAAGMAALNRRAAEILGDPALDLGVRAATDVTGFGLAGHALEMARGAGCDVQIDWNAVPLLPGVRALAAQGMVTGASGRNWAGYGAQAVLPNGFAAEDRALLTDPQTSGGLLVACEPAALEAVLATFRRHGFGDAAVVGRVLGASSSPQLQVTSGR